MDNKFSTLDEMIDSEEYQTFIESKLGNDLFINDPERAERIHEAAEYGCDGALHCEIIEDYRDFLSSIKVFEDEDFDCEEDCLIDAYTESAILCEINAVEEWHIQNGTYEKQVG